mgnify:CR=1 FL=1
MSIGKESLTRTLLIILSALILFAGPTYLLYILDKLHVPYLIMDVLGVVCLIVGVILLRRLLREEEVKMKLS